MHALCTFMGYIILTVMVRYMFLLTLLEISKKLLLYYFILLLVTQVCLRESIYFSLKPNAYATEIYVCYGMYILFTFGNSIHLHILGIFWTVIWRIKFFTASMLQDVKKVK